MYDLSNIKTKDDEFEDKYNDQINDAAIILRNKLKKHSLIANMGEIVESNSDKFILGTTSLDTCYGIVFYDRENKKGIVGHAPPSTKRELLQRMIRMLGEDKHLTIEYSIVPGYRNEERQDYSGFEELMDYLKLCCPPNITLIPFKSDLGIQVHNASHSYEFAFDVNTGSSVGNYLFFESSFSHKYYK